MNVMPCEVERRDGGAHARVGDHDVPLSARLDAASGPTGSLELGIRPEHIAVLADEDAERGLPIAVTAVEDHGRFRIVVGHLGGDRADRPGDRPIKIRIGHAPGQDTAPVVAGGTIRVRFQPEHICLYRDSRIVASGDHRAAEESA
jgi:ABC-type sugar transport system ATPase subunit